MMSLDTNLLLFAFDQDCPAHKPALAFVQALHDEDQVTISEFTLLEFYRLLRNPVVLERPLSAPAAVEIIQAYRGHPRWRVAGFPDSGSTRLHDALWRTAAVPGFAYRRVYDARLALTLRHHGVTEFATSNVKDFQGFGFARVWNPLLKQ